MASSFSFAFGAVLPIFMLVGLGYILRRLGYFPEAFVTLINKFCFEVALPALVFYNIYTSNTTIGQNSGLLIFGALAICGIAAVSLLILPKLVKESPRRAVLAQNMFRSNFILFGIPMAANMYGNDGVGPASILLAISAILYNILGTAIMAYYQEKQRSGKKSVHIVPLLKSIFKNHIIIGAALALVLLSLQIQLPNFLDRTVSDVAKVATPMGLMAVGAHFNFARAKADFRYLMIGLSGKLLIAPAIVMIIAIFCGFRGPLLGALLGMTASPGSITSYVVATSMDADGDLAGELVVFGTALSAFTMFGFIFLLRSLGFL